ncbi:rhodanese-like sulfurtransferase [alpha proteobacterium HIMB114]|nr:rhodanese-like sulfurtransferase [alpha proteobacterium HIMB114]
MNIVDVVWLENNLNNENIIILDCSWHLPNTQRSGKEEFKKERIPGAIFFDIDEISEQESPFPHMMPTEDYFSDKVSELGVSNDHHIITYDSLGVFSSARVYWMFKQFGHKKISILDGGLKFWKIKNKKIETSAPNKKIKTNYLAQLNRSKIKGFEDVKKNTQTKEFKLVDARPSGRFNGTDPEPRKDLQSGNIENSLNIPFNIIVDAETGCFKNKEEIEKIFKEKNIMKKDSLVFSCGSGVAACVVGAAYENLNNIDNYNVFDGSWTEWATKNNLKNS